MKKIVLSILVLMLAGSAMAAKDVNFVAVHEGTTGVVRIYYDANSPPGPLPRAFALDITVDNSQTIDAISDLSVDYWVYPGSIDINDVGGVNDVGTPVADYNDLPSDTELGLGTSGITIEMGSLYVGAANEPDPCALLCKVTVSSDCNLTITGNVGRGKAVLEGAAQAMTNLPIVLMVSPVTPPGFTISGTVATRGAVGEDGVTMTGLPGAPVTAGGGLYTDTVPSGWSGTVTPTKTGKGFVAASITYTNVLANQASQDYLVGDGSCLRADICSTTYGNPDGYITSQDYIWLSTYYPVLPATQHDCLGDASCLRADICSTTYGAPDGLITSQDYIWLSTYYPVLPATSSDCCP